MIFPRPPQKCCEVSSINKKKLFCVQVITDFEERKKCSVIQVCNFQFRKTILKQCSTKSDLWAANVHARLLSVIDLPATEAQYHQVCSGNFRTGKPSQTVMQAYRPRSLICLVLLVLLVLGVQIHRYVVTRFLINEL